MSETGHARLFLFLAVAIVAWIIGFACGMVTVDGNWKAMLVDRPDVVAAIRSRVLVGIQGEAMRSHTRRAKPRPKPAKRKGPKPVHSLKGRPLSGYENWPQKTRAHPGKWAE